MGKVITERISSFNPFTKEFFKCPVCGNDEFVYLAPYGGVWCTDCNADFKVESTCDGLNKVSVHCGVEYCYDKKAKENFDRLGTVIWEDDTEVKWLCVKDRILKYAIPPS